MEYVLKTALFFERCRIKIKKIKKVYIIKITNILQKCYYPRYPRGYPHQREEKTYKIPKKMYFKREKVDNYRLSCPLIHSLHNKEKMGNNPK